LSGGGEVEGEGPKGEGGGEDVGMGQRALREPDGVDGGEEREGEGCAGVEEAGGQAVDGRKGGGGDGADGDPGDQNAGAGDVPERAEEDVRQRWVGVGEVRDEGESVVEVERGGDVVAAFVPVVGEAEEGEVVEGDEGEKCREEYGGGERGQAVG
jgi:hypothetical protein